MKLATMGQLLCSVGTCRKACRIAIVICIGDKPRKPGDFGSFLHSITCIQRLVMTKRDPVAVVKQVISIVRELNADQESRAQTTTRPGAADVEKEPWILRSSMEENLAWKIRDFRLNFVFAMLCFETIFF